MKKLSFAGLAFAALIAGPAIAADLRAPVYVPPAPVVSWTGFYIGGDIGWSDIRQNATTTAYPQPGFGAPPVIGAGGVGASGNLPTAHTLNGNGILGGAHLGYNWQIASWLYGLEGDVMALNYHPGDTETVFNTVGGPAPAFSMLVTAQNRWLASARGRLGWVAGPLLLYGTAGMAFTNSTYNATAGALPALMLPGVGATATSWETKTGYVVGGGAEWMLAPNWLLRVEYLHYGFDATTYSLPLVFVSATDACAPGACYWNVNSSRQNIDTVRVGLSYKFDVAAAAASK